MRKKRFKFSVAGALSFLSIIPFSVIGCIAVEIANGRYKITRHEYFIASLLISLALYMLTVLAFNSYAIPVILCNCISFVLGCTSFYVMKFRGTPFRLTDIASLKTAATVAERYDYTPSGGLIAAFAVLSVSNVLVWLFLRKKHVFPKTFKYPKRLLSWFLCFLSFICLVRISPITDPQFGWDHVSAEQSLGIEGALIKISLSQADYKQPEHYSDDAVQDLLSLYPGEELTQTAELPENVIVIMDEAFFDPYIYPDFHPDMDPIPFIHSLKGKCLTGWMAAPVKGGGTAYTEYEFLTGNSFLEYGAGIPYYSIFRNQDSLAWYMKNLGYRTIAMHPYYAEGYQRKTAFQYLGFDDFLTIENYYQDADTVRDLISDKECVTRIIEQLETKQEGERLFLFNVTMQNHSPYSGDKALPANTDSDVKTYLTDINLETEEREETETYFSLASLSDAAVKQLLDYLQDSDEKTAVCFFGDHQPRLSDAFFESVSGKPSEEYTPADSLDSYMVPFFVWTNYNREEKKETVCQASSLAAVMKEAIGFPLTGYDQFLLNLQEIIPVFAREAYKKADGTCEWIDDAPEIIEEWFEKYRWLTYLANISEAGNSFFAGQE